MVYFIEMQVHISSTDDMKIFGERLGAAVIGGEFVELVGDVGAGKTTLVKGVAVGMGITDTVQSPTFTINRMYDARDDLTLAHYDFYRLADAGIMADELSETVSDPRTVTIVEWGKVIADVKPGDRLVIEIVSPAENERTVTLTAEGETATKLLEAVS